MLHFMEDDGNSVKILSLNLFVFNLSLHLYLSSTFQSSPAHETNQPPSTSFGEPIVPEIAMVSKVTSPRAPQAGAQANPPAFSNVVVGTEVPVSQPQASSQVY